MKTFFNTALTLATATALSLSASAAMADTGNPASDTATATATVVNPITVVKTADLSFGTFAADPSNPGTRTTPTDSGSDNNVYQVGTDTGTDATFDITADAIAYRVVVPGTIDLTDGVTSANDMTATLTPSTPSGTDITGINMAQEFTVTGSLAVAAGQPAGTYTSTFDATATYQ